MPAISRIPTVLFRRHDARVLTAAARAQETAHKLRAQAEQHIIDGECRTTKLALTRDREAWRVYRRREGMPVADFIPYLT